jgi:hypothetical protein
MEDRRTTPPRLRPLALLLLAGTLLYLLAGYRYALAELGYANAPAAFGPSNVFWAAQFHMFNEPRPTMNLVQATVTTNTGVQPVDLPALYPTLREEGPSYARSRFLKDSGRLALMGQDLCRRVGGRSVHLWLEQHPKLGGSVQTVELGTWNCP